MIGERVAIVAVPSVDPLSATTTSNGNTGGVARASDSSWSASVDVAVSDRDDDRDERHGWSLPHGWVVPRGSDQLQSGRCGVQIAMTPVVRASASARWRVSCGPGRVRPPAQRGRCWTTSRLRRPWNLRVKPLAVRARNGSVGIQPGVTVIIVNWNTAEVTADVLCAVQQFSPPETRVLLVDNGSTDGSRERFKGWPGVETLFFPSNAGHGVALDIAVCLDADEHRRDARFRRHPAVPRLA